MHSLHHGEYFLRPPTADDVPSITEAVMESTATVGAWMSWATKDYSQDDASAWVRACEAGHADGSSYEFGIFANSNGRLVGAGGRNQFNKVNHFCNLGYWVRASAQRHGAATAAVAALRDFAFVELRLSRVEIVMAVDND